MCAALSAQRGTAGRVCVCAHTRPSRLHPDTRVRARAPRVPSSRRTARTHLICTRAHTFTCVCLHACAQAQAHALARARAHSRPWRLCPPQSRGSRHAHACHSPAHVVHLHTRPTATSSVPHLSTRTTRRRTNSPHELDMCMCGACVRHTHAHTHTYTHVHMHTHT